MIKCVLVWLAVMAATFHTSQAMCGSRYADGDIRVLGTNTTDILAGRIEICVEKDWQAVCQDGWGSDDASGVCGRLGFNTSRHCTNSCFGRSPQSRGIRQFQCSDRDCSTYTRESVTSACGNDAGIVCSIPYNTSTLLPPAPTCPIFPCPTTTCPTCPMTICPTCSTTTCPMTICPTCPTTTCPTCPMTTRSTCPTCPTTTCPICQTHATSEPTTAVDMTDSTANTSTDNLVGEKNQPAESCPSLAALGGGLGGLCAILAILLVGVVIWSYHRSGKRGPQERPSTPQCEPEDMSPNPCYTVTTHPEATPPAIYEIIDEIKT